MGRRRLYFLLKLFVVGYIYTIMTIAFIHNGKAFLPEIDAYLSFFKGFPAISAKVIPQPGRLKINADVEWHFMGAQLKRSSNAVVIHEYASASVPPFAAFKDMVKRYMNCSPDYRIFYSEYVRDRFNFRDGIACGLRGHGVLCKPPGLKNDAGKEYDFIYTGNTDGIRSLDSLLDCFTTGRLGDHTLLVLSKGYQKLSARFSKYTNIQFKGPVPYAEVYSYIARSAYAINFMPDIAPFNHQVSAKFLDYAACGVPVISSGYRWIKEFERQYGGRYFYLEPDLSNFTWENITSFDYSGPMLEEWTWEKQIRRSGIVAFLQQRFPGIMEDYSP